jgi:glycosyltransferase involved in cell wall biosynthesis
MASSTPVPATDTPIVDVLDISDLRFAGGTAHSIAEEIKAQHSAGYSTALVHLNGPLVAKVAPINQLIRHEVESGHAELLVRGAPVRARLVVVRHPAVLQDAADQLPPIEADHVVIVANAAPHDIDGHEHYRPEHVHRIARRVFGQEPLWAPIGPLVRKAITSRVPASSLVESDWVNIIDVDAWATPRSGPRAERPVVGRHSRSSPQKWPRDAETLRAVYPVDGSWNVQVLGGAEPAEALLGQLPGSWEVYEFGAMPPRDFLAGLDFFVYYHDPRWIAAFGRTILEALASGVPAILPPHFEELFGDAAIYAEPRDVRRIVDELYADRDAYDKQVKRATETARARFGYEAHVARIAGILGEQPGTRPVNRRWLLRIVRLRHVAGFAPAGDDLVDEAYRLRGISHATRVAQHLSTGALVFRQLTKRHARRKRDAFAERQHLARAQRRYEMEEVRGGIGYGGANDRLVTVIRHAHDEQRAALRDDRRIELRRPLADQPKKHAVLASFLGNARHRAAGRAEGERDGGAARVGPGLVLGLPCDRTSADRLATNG